MSTASAQKKTDASRQQLLKLSSSKSGNSQPSRKKSSSSANPKKNKTTRKKGKLSSSMISSKNPNEEVSKPNEQDVSIKLKIEPKSNPFKNTANQSASSAPSRIAKVAAERKSKKVPTEKSLAKKKSSKSTEAVNFPSQNADLEQLFKKTGEFKIGKISKTTSSFKSTLKEKSFKAVKTAAQMLVNKNASNLPTPEINHQPNITLKKMPKKDKVKKKEVAMTATTKSTKVKNNENAADKLTNTSENQLFRKRNNKEKRVTNGEAHPIPNIKKIPWKQIQQEFKKEPFWGTWEDDGEMDDPKNDINFLSSVKNAERKLWKNGKFKTGVSRSPDLSPIEEEIEECKRTKPHDISSPKNRSSHGTLVSIRKSRLHD